MSFPAERPRRLRSTAAMRRLVAQTSLEPRHLVLPMFVADGIDEPRPISAMPGVVQHTRASLRAAAADAVAAGVGGLMIFGVPREDDKDAVGSIGLRPDGILNRALADLAADLGDATVVMADTCLDEFTDTATAESSMNRAVSTTTPPMPSTSNSLSPRRTRVRTSSVPAA